MCDDLSEPWIFFHGDGDRWEFEVGTFRWHRTRPSRSRAFPFGCSSRKWGAWTLEPSRSPELTCKPISNNRKKKVDHCTWIDLHFSMFDTASSELYVWKYNRKRCSFTWLSVHNRMQCSDVYVPWDMDLSFMYAIMLAWTFPFFLKRKGALVASFHVVACAGN